MRSELSILACEVILHSRHDVARPDDLLDGQVGVDAPRDEVTCALCRAPLCVAYCEAVDLGRTKVDETVGARFSNLAPLQKSWTAELVLSVKA